MSRITKEERFLLKILEMAGEAEVDRYHIGKAMGQRTHGVDTIVKNLSQSNFVKKGDGSAIYLTPNGLSLADQLKNSS